MKNSKFISLHRAINTNAILTTLNKQSNYLRLTKCAFLSVLNPLIHHCIDFGFFFFVFSYMNKEHIKRSTSYTNTNQIKSHSYYKIKPTTTKRFFITDHHHTYIYTVAGDFICSNFVLCVEEYGTCFVVGRGLWAHLSAFLLVICYRIHIIAAHFVRHVSSPDIMDRNMCETSSTRSLSFNICFLRFDSSFRVVLPLLIYP